MGHLLETLSSGSLCRMSNERAKNGQASWFRCSTWWAGLCANVRIGMQSGWRDHQARTMNGDSEHLNDCSQRMRVRFHFMVTTCEVENRLITFVCTRRCRQIVLDDNGGAMTRRDDDVAKPYGKISARHIHVLADPRRSRGGGRLRSIRKRSLWLFTIRERSVQDPCATCSHSRCGDIVRLQFV
jgi:hypothetical protein